jgi:hypothetical protein
LEDMSSTYQVAPFGHLRIKVRLQLPVAFRSFPRPSSSLRAKASPVRPYSLPILTQIRFCSNLGLFLRIISFTAFYLRIISQLLFVLIFIIT